MESIHHQGNQAYGVLEDDFVAVGSYLFKSSKQSHYLHGLIFSPAQVAIWNKTCSEINWVHTISCTAHILIVPTCPSTSCAYIAYLLMTILVLILFKSLLLS